MTSSTPEKLLTCVSGSAAADYCLGCLFLIIGNHRPLNELEAAYKLMLLGLQ